MSDQLLAVLAKRNSRFGGTITITDTYGKLPARALSFAQGSMGSYSDQFSSGYYAETFRSASLSITCRSISINGINIEQ